MSNYNEEGRDNNEERRINRAKGIAGAIAEWGYSGALVTAGLASVVLVNNYFTANPPPPDVETIGSYLLGPCGSVALVMATKEYVRRGAESFVEWWNRPIAPERQDACSYAPLGLERVVADTSDGDMEVKRAVLGKE